MMIFVFVYTSNDGSCDSSNFTNSIYKLNTSKNTRDYALAHGHTAIIGRYDIRLVVGYQTVMMNIAIYCHHYIISWFYYCRHILDASMERTDTEL